MKFKNLSRVERNMLTGLFCQFVTILLGFLLPRLYLTYARRCIWPLSRSATP